MILKVDDLETIRKNHNAKKLVLTSGTFDLLHTGHLDYLESVKAYGDILVVMLSGDKRVKARKGNERPIIPEENRARVIDSLKVVDYVFIDPSLLSPTEIDPVHKRIIELLQPDYYVTDGADPRFFDIMSRDKFIILERMQIEPSTTQIIEKIRNLSKQI